MKHPHCNRSKAAHLFWCRGFAPVVFILAIATIVVAIGSGIYFSVSKETAQAPSPQDVGVLAISKATDPVSSKTASTSPVAAPIAPSIASSGKTIAPAATVADCGSNTKTASQCLAEHLVTCVPAKGVEVDPSSGLTVERIIEGYKGNVCSYRTNIVSGSGNFASLSGMEINCLLPKTSLTAMAQEGVMKRDDLFSYCTGSFMDLLREQLGASGQ